MHTTVVFTGGPVTGAAPDPAAGPPGIRSADLVIAADEGLHLADLHGLHVDLVVGDLDSVDPDELDRARRAGAAVESHPEDKDVTDLELALDAAVARGAGHVVVVGSPGGRFDHLVGGLATLAAPRYAALSIEAHLGGVRVLPVHDHRSVTGRVGELVSLVPVHGAAHGVRTEGLRWPLDGETLRAGSGRGISNRFVVEEAKVSVGAGTLLVVVPGDDEPGDSEPGDDEEVRP